MKKVIFTGYYGMQNYGDDLFSIISTYGAQKYWKDFQPSILSPEIKGPQANFYIPKIISTEAYSAENMFGKIARCAPAIIAAVSKDKMIFSGGSLFSSQQSGVRNALSLISKYRNNIFSGIGVSIGPFNSIKAEKKIQDFLKRFEYISVRDKTSFDIANDFNLECPINLSRDLAGLTNFIIPKETHSRESAQTTIGYSPCNISGDYEKSTLINNLVINAIIMLSQETELNVRVINLNKNKNKNYGDEQLSFSAQKQLQENGIKTEYVEYTHSGALKTWTEIASCQAYVSTRLHGAITAYLNETPFTLIEYHSKCTDFLDDIGQASKARIKLNEYTAHDYYETIKALLSNYTPPTLDPKTYSKESITNFSHAPWASSSTN
jgi:polysaccharide pyruvyl transferase WcaK-like protein